jgi:hypothetical protein
MSFGDDPEALFESPFARLGERGAAKRHVAVVGQQVARGDGLQPRGLKPAAYVPRHAMPAEVSESTMQGVEEFAQSATLVARSQLRPVEQPRVVAQQANRVGHLEGVDLLVMRGEVEATERPRDDSEAFGVPGRAGRLKGLEGTEWGFEEALLVGVEFIAEGELVEPRSQSSVDVRRARATDVKATAARECCWGSKTVVN